MEKNIIPICFAIDDAYTPFFYCRVNHTKK